MKIRQHEMMYQEKNKIKPPSEGPGPGCLTFRTSVSPSAKRNRHLTSRALRAWETVRGAWHAGTPSVPPSLSGRHCPHPGMGTRGR